MSEQQRHEMNLQGTLPSGAEEWSCPICGRRTLISWEPDFKRTVLEAGDYHAIHSASKGGLQVRSLEIHAEEDGHQPSDEDPRLAPWLNWLDKSDFESRWIDDA